jgi:hypothetical protein
MTHFVLALACLLGFATPSWAFYGPRAQKGHIKFTSEVYAEANSSRPHSATAEYQASHLLGYLQATAFKKETGVFGTLSDEHKITLKKIETLGTTGLVKITYDYEGHAVLDKRIFKADEISIPLMMPKDPARFYYDVRDRWGLSEGVIPCTEPDYTGAGDFFYFWDAYKPGCKLRDNTDLILRVNADVEAIPNTARTYPNYSEIYGDNGNGGVFDVAIFVGYIGGHRQIKNPNRRDLGYYLFRELQSDLRERGFQWVTPPELRKGFRLYEDGRRVQGLNYLLEFKKIVGRKGKAAEIRVKLMLAETPEESRDITFRTYFKKALEKSDIVYYDGHAGGGTALQRIALPNLELNPDKHQVFIFNGCSSYHYLGEAFFGLKGGSDTLDVITAGMVTLTSNAMPNFNGFMNGFLNLETPSYQSMLNRVERSFVEKGDFLLNVNGDDDNDWEP